MATQRATAVGTATDQTGSSAINTVKVSNQLVQEIKLKFSLTAGSSDVTNILLFPGAQRTGTELNIKSGLTFDGGPGGFATWPAFVSYYRSISTSIFGLQIQTTDVDNYESNTISIFETWPSGQPSNPVYYDLSDYRVSNGSTWNDKIILDKLEFNPVAWAALEMAIASIKANSKMTFTFFIRGWNKVQEQSPIQANVIS